LQDDGLEEIFLFFQLYLFNEKILLPVSAFYFYWRYMFIENRSACSIPLW